MVANRLKTYLDAYTSPRRVALDSEVDQLPLPRRRGEAFCALLEHLPAKACPKHGGTATQVLVMIDYDTLMSQVGAGVARDLHRRPITAGEARRLACTAGIIPSSWAGRAEILDQGRSTRLFKGPLRIALDVRDRRCRAEGCDIPAAWCEAHHDKDPWAESGHTDPRRRPPALPLPPPPRPRPCLHPDPPPQRRPSLPSTMLSQGVRPRRSYVVSVEVCRNPTPW